MPPARRVIPPHMDADDDGTFDSRYYTETEVDAAIAAVGGGGGAVDSVNGATGAVVLDADDISDTATVNQFTTTANLTKLAGIATGATANSSDATLLSRANHTGTQAASTISDFDTEVSNNASVAANTAKTSYPSADATKLAGIEASADVTDATNVNAAGAVMNSDTTTASMAFVIDEDAMTSDSSTKVPTQQSVKAYVDASGGGASAIDDLTDVTITTATSGQVLKYNGTAWVNDTDLAGGGGGTVTSVNTQTGDVVLDADDIDDTSTTNKFVTASDITNLGNLSGTNSGDQDLSDYFDTTTDTLDDITAGTTNTHFTATEKTKLSGIATGAEVNVQSDWDAVSGDALILNKPTLGTAADNAETDFAAAAHSHASGDVTDFGEAVRDTMGLALQAGAGAKVTTLDGSDLIRIQMADDDKAKLDAIEALADVTDATNVAAAGAVMEADTSTASMGFVVDEDDLSSDSATKVPTQQSVKAYVDASAGGSPAWGSITGTLANQTDLDTALDGKAATSHNHAAADVTSGTLDIARIPTGDTSTTVALGDHGHSDQAVINFVIDGGGDVIATGVKGDILLPTGLTISHVTLMADQVGSIVVDIWSKSYALFPPTDADSITGSTPPTITADDTSRDTTLTGWTASIPASQVVRVNVDSCSTITRCTLALFCTRTVS